MNSMFPESKDIKLPQLKAILKRDLRYTYRIPQLRVVQAQREDVKRNREIFKSFFCCVASLGA